MTKKTNYRSLINKMVKLYLVLLFLLQTTILTVSYFVLYIIGLFITPIGLMYSIKDSSIKDNRDIDNFPKLLWLFGNDVDGTLGDKKFQWDRDADETVLFGLLPILRKLGFKINHIDSKSFIARYWWMAIKNPLSNLKLIPYLSCPINKCIINVFGNEEIKNNRGFRFISATHKYLNFTWCNFYCIYKYPFISNKALEINLGFDIKPEDVNDINAGNKKYSLIFNLLKTI